MDAIRARLLESELRFVRSAASNAINAATQQGGGDHQGTPTAAEQQGTQASASPQDEETQNSPRVSLHLDLTAGSSFCSEAPLVIDERDLNCSPSTAR